MLTVKQMAEMEMINSPFAKKGDKRATYQFILKEIKNKRLNAHNVGYGKTKPRYLVDIKDIEKYKKTYQKTLINKH